jgi:hypothetical protein
MKMITQMEITQWGLQYLEEHGGKVFPDDLNRAAAREFGTWNLDDSPVAYLLGSGYAGVDIDLASGKLFVELI